jgi:hypothetical protein
VSREDRDLLVQELIKLAPLVAMVLVMHNLPWLQHQVWRARTFTERKARAESAALRQVHKEISDMEHEVGA